MKSANDQAPVLINIGRTTPPSYPQYHNCSEIRRRIQHQLHVSDNSFQKEKLLVHHFKFWFTSILSSNEAFDDLPISVEFYIQWSLFFWLALMTRKGVHMSSFWTNLITFLGPFPVLSNKKSGYLCFLDISFFYNIHKTFSKTN